VSAARDDVTATPLWRALRRAIDAWALAGGVVLLALVAVNVAAVAGAALGRRFAGDVELTELGVAIAVFTFLPFCQLHGENVRADLFTGAAPRGLRRGLDAAASAVALGVAGLLLWRMTAGLIDQRAFGYSSTLLEVPLWWAFVPVVISLALLAVAAAMTLAQAVTGAAEPRRGAR